MITTARLWRWVSMLTAVASVAAIMSVSINWVTRHRIHQPQSRKAIPYGLTPTKWIEFFEMEQSAVCGTSDDLEVDIGRKHIEGDVGSMHLNDRTFLNLETSSMENHLRSLEAVENDYGYAQGLPGVAPPVSIPFTIRPLDEQMKDPPVLPQATQPGAPSSTATVGDKQRSGQ